MSSRSREAGCILLYPTLPFTFHEVKARIMIKGLWFMIAVGIIGLGLTSVMVTI